MYRPCGAIDDTYEKDLAIVRTGSHWGLLIGGLIALAAGAIAVFFALRNSLRQLGLWNRFTHNV